MSVSLEAYASTVIGVPPYAAAALFTDVMRIKHFGTAAPSHHNNNSYNNNNNNNNISTGGCLISCVLLETAVGPSSPVGVVRRLTLALPGCVDTILRERLSSISPNNNNNNNNNNNTLYDITSAQPHKTRVCWEYIPCDNTEIHRSPFGVAGAQRLQRAMSEIIISEITSNPNRCFLEMRTHYTVNASETRGEDREKEKFAIETIMKDISKFWNLYVSRTVAAAEDYLLAMAFPVLNRQIDTEFESEFDFVEEKYCRWAARNSNTSNNNNNNNNNSNDNISRIEVLEVLEKALVSWGRLRRELRHQLLMNIKLQDDAAGAAMIAATASAQVAKVEAMNINNNNNNNNIEEINYSVGNNNNNNNNNISLNDMYPRQPRRSTAPLVDVTLHNNKSNISMNSATQGNTQESYNNNNNNNNNNLNLEQRIPFFASGGGRRLSIPEEKELNIKKQQQEENNNNNNKSPPHRPASVEFNPTLLHNFLTDIGTINEKDAQTLFNILDNNQEGFITEKGINIILQHIDPLGLYEDQNGTFIQMAECRQVIGTGVFKNITPLPESLKKRIIINNNNNNNNNETENTSGVAEQKQNINDQLTPLQALVRRHDLQKKAMQEEVIKKRSNELLNHFAYRTRGRLYYDEFCLMMLHLLKEY